MTRWKIKGKVLSDDEFVDYLDDNHFETFMSDFERDYNGSHDATQVLFDYSPDDYYRAFREWLRETLKSNPHLIEDFVDVERVGSAQRKPKAQPRKANGQFARKPKGGRR